MKWPGWLGKWFGRRQSVEPVELRPRRTTLEVVRERVIEQEREIALLEAQAAAVTGRGKLRPRRRGGG